MNSKQLLFSDYIFLHFYITKYYCLQCDNPAAWKCPNDNLCLYGYSEVCVPPPFDIKRCPNGGDYGNYSCTEESCKELYKSYLVKCPNSPYCVI